MDNERVVTTINNNPVYFDGFIYYVKMNGNIIAVDENKLRIKYK